jgi:hypothetical protein
MDLVINPYIGIGQIKLGMTQSQIRNTINSEFKSFVRNKYSELPHDHFMELGIIIEYKQPGICDSIQAFSPTNPIWRGQQLLNTSFSELDRWFLNIDPDRELDNCGLTSYKYGIGIYAPYYEEEANSLPESIIVFTRGYYDK